MVLCTTNYADYKTGNRLPVAVFVLELHRPHFAKFKVTNLLFFYKNNIDGAIVTLEMSNFAVDTKNPNRIVVAAFV